jgi:hypothetical protein
MGGGESSGGNAQTVFVQLKTLVERLEYVRMKCTTWIQNELQLVADAMGFSKTPTVAFQTMNLKDEVAEKQLLIQLLDRNIVSAETVQKIFGKDFEIELENMRYEDGIREKDPGLLEKANPYYRPQSIIQLQKDMQIELEKSKNGGGDNLGGDQPKTEQVTGPGRPKNIPDTKTRKVRTPKVLAIYKAMAEGFMDNLDELIDPIFLEKSETKNIRSLPKDKKDELQNIKFVVLSQLDEKSVLNKDEVNKIIENADKNKINEFFSVFKDLKNDYTSVKGDVLAFKEIRSLAASVWASMNSEE